MKLSFVLVAALACQALAAPSKDSSILKTLQTKRSATVIVSVTGSNVASITNDIKISTFANRDERLNTLYSSLKGHADETQAPILAFLNKQKSEKPLDIFQLWITNEIIVKGADYETVAALLAMDEVAAVEEERTFPLEEPRDLIVHPDGTVPNAGEQWGVRDIEAPAVHASGNTGVGAVIGTIDTGVRGTHAALKDSHRANHGWFDPYAATANPNDQNGHGTHTAGTIAGRANGIGVAPGAKWISCKGCSTDGCTNAALKACGQFMTCPTNPQGGNADCSKAPNAVSNSWAGGQGQTWFDEVMSAWVAGGIAPIFAMGNNGPNCGTANSPGDSTIAIGVGSTNEAGGLSTFSSAGPTTQGKRIKPDIAAPGTAVVSSHHLSDTAYATMSGTSMATPHVSGLAALLYSAHPNFTVAQLRTALRQGAKPVTSSGRNCGGVSEGTYPNNAVGKGRINAVASLNVAKSL